MHSFKITKLVFTDPTGKLEDKEIKGKELPEIQLQCAQSIPVPAADAYADVDPNTKFKDIPAADVAAGKYKVVMAVGSEKEVFSLTVNNFGVHLKTMDRQDILQNYGNAESKIESAIKENKLKGLKVKR